MSNSKLTVSDGLFKLASSGEKSLEWFRDVEASLKIQAFVEVTNLHTKRALPLWHPGNVLCMYRSEKEDAVEVPNQVSSLTCAVISNATSNVIDTMQSNSVDNDDSDIDKNANTEIESIFSAAYQDDPFARVRCKVDPKYLVIVINLETTFINQMAATCAFLDNLLSDELRREMHMKDNYMESIEINRSDITSMLIKNYVSNQSLSNIDPVAYSTEINRLLKEMLSDSIDTRSLAEHETRRKSMVTRLRSCGWDSAKSNENDCLLGVNYLLSVVDKAGYRYFINDMENKGKLKAPSCTFHYALEEAKKIHDQLARNKINLKSNPHYVSTSVKQMVGSKRGRDGEDFDSDVEMETMPQQTESGTEILVKQLKNAKNIARRDKKLIKNLQTTRPNSEKKSSIKDDALKSLRNAVKDHFSDKCFVCNTSGHNAKSCPESSETSKEANGQAWYQFLAANSK